MKQKRLFAVVIAMALASALALPAMAQSFCTLKGTFKGTDGKPLPDVQVELVNTINGQKYQLKTNKRGEFNSIGIAAGKYNITFSKDGKPIWKLTGYEMSLQKENGENDIDVDLQKEATQQPQMSPEEQKKREEAIKASETIKGLNAMLTEGRAAEAAGNLDQAIAIYTKATATDATRPLLWAVLGNATLASAKKETDAAARTQKLDSAANAYKKAIDLAGTSTDPKAKASLGGYYNNYAEVLVKSNKTPEAVAAYESAATADPANAAMYFFNEGATMTNSNKPDEAIVAYDKVIAADPTKADAYYLKGIALLGKATLKGDKMVPVPGTAEAFNKYLELEPTGKYADNAKQMISSIGATVQTTYGTKSKGAGKKK